MAESPTPKIKSGCFDVLLKLFGRFIRVKFFEL